LDKVPADLRRSIWIRDEFSCKSCGRTLGWEELNIGFMGKGDDPESMITLCSDCISSDDRPIDDPRLSRFLGIVRELEGIEADFEPACPSELTMLKEAFAQLESDNRFLKEDNEKKFRMMVSYKGQFEKAQEDYQNLKKRSEREVSSRVNLAMRRTMLGVISSLDDLDRTIDSLDERSRAGVIGVKKNLFKTLEECGVTSIEPDGGKFDPNLHEAVDAKERDDLPDGTIISVQNSGYMFEGKVLRPARVTVSRSGRKEAVEFELFEEDESMEEGPVQALPSKGLSGSRGRSGPRQAPGPLRKRRVRGRPG
jgi:molecular chaperone GrpE